MIDLYTAETPNGWKISITGGGVRVSVSKWCQQGVRALDFPSVHYVDVFGCKVYKAPCDVRKGSLTHNRKSASKCSISCALRRGAGPATPGPTLHRVEELQQHVRDLARSGHIRNAVTRTSSRPFTRQAELFCACTN